MGDKREPKKIFHGFARCALAVRPRTALGLDIALAALGVVGKSFRKVKAPRGRGAKPSAKLGNVLEVHWQGGDGFSISPFMSFLVFMVIFSGWERVRWLPPGSVASCIQRPRR